MYTSVTYVRFCFELFPLLLFASGTFFIVWELHTLSSAFFTIISCKNLYFSSPILAFTWKFFTFHEYVNIFTSSSLTKYNAMSVNRLIQECFAVNAADSIRNLVLNHIAEGTEGGGGQVTS